MTGAAINQNAVDDWSAPVLSMAIVQKCTQGPSRSDPQAGFVILAAVHSRGVYARAPAD